MKPIGYNTAQKATLSGRQLERELLERVNARLRNANQPAPGAIAAKHEALRLNRTIWMTFAADLAAPKNALPNELRASLISLAAFVERKTPEAQDDDGALQALIDVNTAIINGLAENETAMR